MDIALQQHWQRLNPTTQPPAHRGTRMAYDTKRQQTVLVVPGQTWLWQNAVWSKVSSQSNPPARNTTHLSYDVSTECVLLFGGIGMDGTPLNDVWLWNGSTWTEQTPASFPTAVGGASMACNVAGKQVILFGGIVGFDGVSGSNRVGTLSDQTWLWNGTSWTEQSTSSTPPARIGAQLVYDEAHQQTLLFGGNSLNGYLNDMWLWNGTDWEELSPATLPPAQARYSAIFHEQLQQVMLLGEVLVGENQDQPSYQTWLWNGISWSQYTTNAAPTGSIESIAYNVATESVLASVVSGGKLPPAGKSAAAVLPNVAAPSLGSETWSWG
jgi:hypothetical protein